MADYAEMTRRLLEAGFLGSLRQAERFGMGGTPLKLFNQTVQHGRRAPIDEKDFSKTDLAALEQLIRAKAAATGAREGKVDYPDYASARGAADFGVLRDLSQVLGGFQYSIGGDGTITATDTYDFNMDRAGKDFGIASDIEGAAITPRNYAAKIGRARLPDTGGGVPVSIKIK